MEGVVGEMEEETDFEYGDRLDEETVVKEKHELVP